MGMFMHFEEYIRCPYCSILNNYKKLDWIMVCNHCHKRFKLKTKTIYLTEKADDINIDWDKIRSNLNLK